MRSNNDYLSLTALFTLIVYLNPGQADATFLWSHMPDNNFTGILWSPLQWFDHKYYNYIITYISNTVNSQYLELSRNQQICSRHREFDLSSSHFV